MGAGAFGYGVRRHEQKLKYELETYVQMTYFDRFCEKQPAFHDDE